jgi:hypothetical protein
VFSAVTPAQADRLAVLDKLLSLTVQRDGHLTAALSGFALLILSNGLWRRKRTSWLMALVVLMISSISFLIEGLNFVGSLLAIAGPLAAGHEDQFQTLRPAIGPPGITCPLRGSLIHPGLSGRLLSPGSPLFRELQLLECGPPDDCDVYPVL